MASARFALLGFFAAILGVLPALAEPRAAEKLPKPCEDRRVLLQDQDPVSGATRTITLSDYDPKPGASVTVGGRVLIIPPTGGVSFIDEGYGKSLCKKGVPSTLIRDWSDPGPVDPTDLRTHRDGSIRGLSAIEQVLETHLRGARIGILGTSLGGIFAAMILARHSDRIDGAVLIVAGGNMAHVLARSELKVLREFRELRFRKYGYSSIDEYEAALREVVPHEPLEMLQSATIDPSKVRLVIGGRDTSVPTSDQLLLKKALGDPETRKRPFGHVKTVVLTYLFNRSWVTGFLKDRLSNH